MDTTLLNHILRVIIAVIILGAVVILKPVTPLIGIVALSLSFGFLSWKFPRYTRNQYTNEKEYVRPWWFDFLVVVNNYDTQRFSKHIINTIFAFIFTYLIIEIASISDNYTIVLCGFISITIIQDIWIILERYFN